MIWSVLAAPAMRILESTLDRLIPDKHAREKAQQLLEEKQADFENDFGMALMDISKAQLDVNKVEAAHKSIFVAGWRPFIGWVCGMGIFWSFLGAPMAEWMVVFFKPENLALAELPKIQVGQLMQLVLAMLGMGGLRTFEKMKGVAREK